MKKKLRLLIIGFALFVAIAACERLDEGVTNRDQPIEFESADGIPLEYGEFVSVTSIGGYAATLWFIKSDQTIVGVQVNVATGQISKTFVAIERN